MSYALVAAFGFIVAWMVGELIWHVVAVAGVTLLHRPGIRSSRGKSGVHGDRRVTNRGVKLCVRPGVRARTTEPGCFPTGSKL